jgi:hypothetical protein
VYVFFCQAVATEKNKKFRTNNRHALLVYVRAALHDQASEIALRELSELGWKLITFERAKVITDDPALISDSILREAAESAQKNGCGVVAYEEPIKPRKKNGT